MSLVFLVLFAHFRSFPSLHQPTFEVVGLFHLLNFLNRAVASLLAQSQIAFDESRTKAIDCLLPLATSGGFQKRVAHILYKGMHSHAPAMQSEAPTLSCYLHCVEANACNVTGSTFIFISSYKQFSSIFSRGFLSFVFLK